MIEKILLKMHFFKNFEKVKKRLLKKSLIILSKLDILTLVFYQKLSFCFLDFFVFIDVFFVAIIYISSFNFLKKNNKIS